jgi:hypothetical protein
MPRNSASKKAWWLASAIVLTWRGDEPSGQNIKIASTHASLTRPGLEQTRRPYYKEMGTAWQQAGRQGPARTLEDDDLACCAAIGSMRHGS